MNQQYRLLYIVAIALIARDAYAGGQSYLVGGTPAKVGEFPYMVSLRINDKHACGGAIVEERHVVTAAHCVHSLLSWRNTGAVVTGSVRRDDGQIHDIKSFTKHIRYYNPDTNSPYDIAVIALEKNITFNVNQTSVALPHGRTPSGVTATLAGWGRTDASVALQSPDLLKINTTILDHKNCSASARRRNNIREGYHICTLNPRGTGACQGDSGGPLVYDGTLIGIDSFGYGCGEGYPQVFINVSHFVPWIQEQIAETYRTEGVSAALHIGSTHFQNILKAELALHNALSIEEINP